MRVALRNPGKGVALMIRLKLVDTQSSLLVTPIMYSDNYVSLVPGEVTDVTIQFDAGNVPGGDAALMVEGWNVALARWSASWLISGGCSPYHGTICLIVYPAQPEEG